MTQSDPLRQEIIPTLVSYSPTRREMVIGDEARALGIKGHTNAHGFKMQVGSPPSEFDKKTYWVEIPEPGKPPATTFSCRDITTLFLKAVLKQCVGRYEKIMVGIPAVQDENWMEHYRSNIRSIIQTIGFSEPSFLPEPFAVFQYYRHVEKLIPDERRSQTILLIDIGGGTCNTSIVKTTSAGSISLRGLGSKPYGTRAVNFGGKALDAEFLRASISTNVALHRTLKDNPIERAKSNLSACLKVEDAKLILCDRLKGVGGFSELLVKFERGELESDSGVQLVMSSRHLEMATRTAWTHHWLQAVTVTIKEAQDQLGEQITLIDKVLLCGGCGQLPFLREYVTRSLSQWLQSADDVIVGKTPGFAVACGIQKECEIRAGKEPSLIANDLGRWALSSMYLGVRRNRVESYVPVRVRGRNGNPFLLVPEWSRLDDQVFECEIDLPFQLKDRLFFGLFDRPVTSDPHVIPLNIQQDTVRIPPGAYRDDGKFLLKQSSEGGLQCEIILQRRTARREEERLKLPEFYPESLRVHTGKSILGLDFGTSNTYLVELDLAEDIRKTDYFSFRIRPRVKDVLAELEAKIARASKDGFLTLDTLEKHARDSRIDFVCHSIKIEGADLTRGETVDVLENAKNPSSPGQKEAQQLGEAYTWILDSYKEFRLQPEGFARHLNGLLLQGQKLNAGIYRTELVKIETRDGDYFPPDGPLVPVEMREWGKSAGADLNGRSVVEFAAALHSIFVRIHPFVDGNGRTARLLVNAALLSFGLPVVVPTIDDRERYIDGLAASDSGDGDEFTLYLCELMEESLDAIREAHVSTHDEKELKVEPKVDLSLDDEDPLATVMGRLIAQDRLPAKMLYEPWKATFESLRAELELSLKQFNAQWSDEGYDAKLSTYDFLSEEKFTRIYLNLPTTKTWFFGLDLGRRSMREKFLFFFEHNTNPDTEDNLGTVVLRIGRHDGDAYRDLTPDVCRPCEIGWKDGSIHCEWPQPLEGTKPLRHQVRMILAELIKAFLEKPSDRSAA
jgi:Fic family protein